MIRYAWARFGGLGWRTGGAAAVLGEAWKELLPVKADGSVGVNRAVGRHRDRLGARDGTEPLDGSAPAHNGAPYGDGVRVAENELDAAA
jgi:hypothetical protein